eukprot:scaffold117891_cov34-Tisochrysis_lutea.AAC.3
MMRTAPSRKTRELKVYATGEPAAGFAFVLCELHEPPPLVSVPGRLHLGAPRTPSIKTKSNQGQQTLE